MNENKRELGVFDLTSKTDEKIEGEEINLISELPLEDAINSSIEMSTNLQNFILLKNETFSTLQLHSSILNNQIVMMKILKKLLKKNNER